MKNYGFCAMLSLVLVSTWPQAGAQTIYRCGNEYTNNARQAKEKNCKAVEGGHVTVIHGGSARPTTSGANVSGGSSTPRPPAARADSPEQRSRDGDAKAILQAELDKANARLASMKAEFKDGNPDRTALELRNPQGYPERVEALKANIARQESDIVGIQRELARVQ